MIIDVSYVRECVTPWAGLLTQKALSNHLKNFGKSKIELSEVLEFFYKKDGKINASSDTLNIIITGLYGEEELRFIRANPHLSSKKMVEGLELVKLLRTLGHQIHTLKSSRLLAAVVQEDKPEVLSQFIVKHPSALFLALLAKPNFSSILEELEKLSEHQQLTIWQHRNMFSSTALEIAICSKKNLELILASIRKLSPNAQASIWQQKDASNTNPFLMALRNGVTIAPILESFKNLTLEQRFTLWKQPATYTDNALITAFRRAKTSPDNFTTILAALGDFSTNQQFELWRAIPNDCSTAFQLALQSDELNFKKSLIAFGSLSIEQQLTLCTNVNSNLFNAFKSSSKCALILQVIEQFTQEQQFKLWTQAQLFYPLISYGFQYELAVKMFIQTAEALAITIWPQSYDFRLWEFHPIFEGVLEINDYNYKVFFETLKLLTPQIQLFFWLGMNRATEKPHLIDNVLRKNSSIQPFIREIASWPLLNQLKLAKHLIANNKHYETFKYCSALGNAWLILRSIEETTNQFINALDNFDEAQNTVINYLNKMGSSSSEKADIYAYLGQKIRIVIEIETLRGNNPDNFSDVLRSSFQDKKSPLYKAFNKQITLVSSIFAPETRAVRKLGKKLDTPSVKTLPKDHPANYQSLDNNNSL